MPIPDYVQRLYLDTADLLDIADKRVDESIVVSLADAMEEHAVALIISHEHMIDALVPGDPVSVDQLSTALEQFRLRFLVLKGPEQVEPWAVNGHAQDIDIEGCHNIREILTAPEAAANLLTSRTVQDAAHRGATSSNASRRLNGDLRIPRHQREIALQSSITQFRGWMGSDPLPIVLHHLERNGGTPTAAEVENLVQAQQPFANVLDEVGPSIDAHGIDRTALLRRIACSVASDGFRVAPGAWLGAKLYNGLSADLRRTPLRSDLVDCMHATYFPYIDIATCDAQSHVILSRFINQAHGSRPRSATLFRNGRLSNVIAHIKTLPTGAERFAGKDG